MDSLNPYRKTIAAIVVGLIGWASAVVTSDPSQITAGEWVTLATVVATAAGVYQITNEEV